MTLWNSISIPPNGVPSSFANAGLGSASGIGSMSDADSRISKTRLDVHDDLEDLRQLEHDVVHVADEAHIEFASCT